MCTIRSIPMYNQTKLQKPKPLHSLQFLHLCILPRSVSNFPLLLPLTFQHTTLTRPHTACMCNAHAPDCQYMVSSMSALCINCTDNTMGDMCEQCLPQFYQDATLLLDNPNICRGTHVYRSSARWPCCA